MKTIKGFVQNHRSSLNSLAEGLIDEGDTTRAKDVLLFSINKIQDRAVPYDLTSVTTIDLLFKTGQKEKAIEIANIMGPRAYEMAVYEMNKYSGISLEIRKDLYILDQLQEILYRNGEMELGKKFEDQYTSVINALQVTEESNRRNF